MSQRTPFYIGQPSDAVVQVNKRTGRRIVDRKVLNPLAANSVQEVAAAQSAQAIRDILVVQWELSCGTLLVFRANRGPTDKGSLCYRISEIKLRPLDKPKQSRRKRKRRK